LNIIDNRPKHEVKRIQRKRSKGFRLPLNTLCIGRGKGCKYPNPYTVKEFGLERCLILYEGWLNYQCVYVRGYLDDLKRYDYVACWCPVNKPCHGDILLRKAREIGIIANE